MDLFVAAAAAAVEVLGMVAVSGQVVGLVVVGEGILYLAVVVECQIEEIHTATEWEGHAVVVAALAGEGMERPF